MRLRVLYLPVACTTHPANTDPTDIDKLFGIICIPVQRINDSRGGVSMGLPAMEALVIGTVWNHMGKKYMTEKLQMATRKLEIPTKTGILRRKRKGANIGSGATKISTKMNAMENTTAIIREVITAGLDHCERDEIGIQEFFHLQGTHGLACIVPHAKEYKRRANLTDVSKQGIQRRETGRYSRPS